MRRFVLSSLIATSPLFAQDGKTLYTTYCSACHAPDGKGASNGMFPPLAKSEWVEGDPDRIIQVVLRGLQGKISAAGKDYNLVMPPQGAALTDDQISKIITYVRGAWGNQEKPVTVAQVKAGRAKHTEQALMWDSEKLLKLYPMENAKKKPRGINDLLSYIHHGTFKSLKDLRASKPKNAEEEKGGLISLSHADRKDLFGLVWEGWLDVPYDGRYTFTFNTDDGGAVTINNKQIITRDQIGAAKKPSRGSIHLKKGRAPIKIEYFEFKGFEKITLTWDGPGVRNEPLSEGASKKNENPPIPLKPSQGEALIYRNFIAGTDARAIGVGYSEGVNLSFSADSMALDLIWTGKFIDAGRHWTNRGQGFEAPAGEEIITLNRGIPFNFLESQTAKWNPKPNPEFPPRFRGYQLNQKQQPTFIYDFGSISFQDEILPIADKKQFQRTITLAIQEKEISDRTLYFRAFSGNALTSKGERNFTTTDGSFTLSVPSSPHPPFARDKELLIPIPLDQAEQTLKLTYTWK